MRGKIFTLTLSLALFSLATTQTARAQEDGEAQAVVFDANNHPALMFTWKRADKQGCGLFVSYTSLDNQEEAFVIRAYHVHDATFGGADFAESGLLYVTPTRLIFVVEKGDKSHGFDLPRTALKEKPKPATIQYRQWIWVVQISFKEKLPGSNSREQKFTSSVLDNKMSSLPERGLPKCYPAYYFQSHFYKFLEGTVNDFNGAVSEFNQIATSLKQSGKSLTASSTLMSLPNSDSPVRNPPRTDPAPSNSQTASPTPRQESSLGTASVDITSEPAGAEIYVDGRFNSSTPSKILLSVGEHTIKVTRPGYKDWERKIIVEQGSVKTFNAILEKQ